MQSLALLAASALAPFFVDVSPEVRSTYVSLGKIMEDRPMQVTGVRAGCGTDGFGRFGLRNWDVSSLTGRRHDVHRHALHHTEFGPAWDCDFDLADEWTLRSDVTRSWTVYRGFTSDYSSSNRTYSWWQTDQSLENPYLVPFCRLRRCFRGSDYTYFKAGVRRRFPLPGAFAITPGVFAEGGSARCVRRIAGGPRLDGGRWHSGAAAVAFRLELGWTFNENVSVFAFVEQYETAGQAVRHAVSASSSRCAHNDWTLGGAGCRFRF